jgi:hypothetical protein
MMHKVRLAMIAAGALLLLAPQSAWADAIDGDWCSTQGKHFTIDGSKFTTPGGKQITGKYDRHAYAYSVPEAEPGAGSTVLMTLVDDDTLHLTPGAPKEAKMQVWKRCDLTS